jgi:hypothetical protein
MAWFLLYWVFIGLGLNRAFGVRCSLLSWVTGLLCQVDGIFDSSKVLGVCIEMLQAIKLKALS